MRMEMRRYKEKKNRRQSEEYKQRKRLGSTQPDEDSPLRKISKLTQGLPVVVDNGEDDIEMELDRMPALTEASRLAAAEEESAQDSPTINLTRMNSRCVDELDTLQKPMRDKMRQQA